MRPLAEWRHIWRRGLTVSSINLALGSFHIVTHLFLLKNWIVVPETKNGIELNWIDNLPCLDALNVKTEVTGPAGSRARRFRTRWTFLLQEDEESSNSWETGGRRDEDSRACLQQETQNQTFQTAVINIFYINTSHDLYVLLVSTIDCLLLVWFHARAAMISRLIDW